jgi:hypothetical protein
MKRLNILIFPCGSEVGLELNRSLKYSRHFKIWGGSSVDDHGKYVFKNYLGGIPLISDGSFITHLAEMVQKYSIDAIYPTLDMVSMVLKKSESELSCKIIGSSTSTARICLSKNKTYAMLSKLVRTPKKIGLDKKDIQYPVFMKPDVGYGSRGAKKVYNKEEVLAQLGEYPESLIIEYLPGDEYTVDCFTDRTGELKFVGPRIRQRIRMGISVCTRTIEGNGNSEFAEIASIINNAISFRGAWFFQLKRDVNGRLCLLEVACRIGGSTGIFRAKGVNLALLSVWDAFDIDVEIIENNQIVEMDRAFDCKYKIDSDYDSIYVDFDDCIIIEDKINIELLGFLYHGINIGKRIILITKHKNNINDSLKRYKLLGVFDEVIKIGPMDRKSDFINSHRSIFIDDSYSERKEVAAALNIPVFTPDIASGLM